MASHLNIIPFIMKAEGGWVDNPSDPGGETNIGITYATWQTFFGPTHDRFLAMAPADWAVIFKCGYWDVVLGDQINSQRIADIIVDYVWGSGKPTAEKEVQSILINVFGAQITEDGDFGPETIAAINAADEPTLWYEIIMRRCLYIAQITAGNHTFLQFLLGWMNRMSDLVAFETPKQTPPIA